MNGDGYVGGEGDYTTSKLLLYLYDCSIGLEGKIEVKNHIDFNRDGVIGRPLDTIPTANTTGTAGGNTNY